MADHTFTGASSGDWGTAGNWNGGVPSANGRAIIPAGAVAITSFTSGQNIDLGSIIILRGAKNNIGGPGNFLTLSCTTASSQEGRVLHMGSGTLYYKDGSTGPTAEVLIDAEDPAKDAAHLDGTTITRVVVRRGRVTAESTMASPTHVEVDSRGGSHADATLTISDSATTWTNVRVNGGSLYFGVPMTALYVAGNSYVEGNANAGTLATVVQTGGTVVLNATGTIVTNYYLMGGTLDLTKNQLPKTITSLFWSPRAVLKWNKNLHTISNSTSGVVGAYYGQSELS